MSGAARIAIAPTGGRVTVRAGGAVIATSSAALTLSEGAMRPVQYIPRAEVAMTLLQPSATRSRCPYKGEAEYFSLDGVDIAWSYPAPIPDVAPIAGMLAFYPERVDSIELADT